MAVTLEEIRANSNSKLVQGFINELITDSYLLSVLPFDNCMSTNGISDLVYKYKRVTQGATAAFRGLNEEPAVSEVKTTPVTTSPGILSSAWEMDRVAKQAADDLYALKVAESKNAIIRMFNKTIINGDTAENDKGFDGIAKALKGSSTEFTSSVDMGSIDRATALAFANEMDTLLAALTRDPDVILMGKAMKTKVNAACRALGINNVTMDDAGHRVNSWDGIRIEALNDGAIATDDIYALCIGMEDFHGITLVDDAVSVALPDWSTPGAVFDYQSECHCSKTLGGIYAKGEGFDYQSECHCSKTGIVVCLIISSFDYQSECHCSKTPLSPTTCP